MNVVNINPRQRVNLELVEVVEETAGGLRLILSSGSVMRVTDQEAVRRIQDAFVTSALVEGVALKPKKAAHD